MGKFEMADISGSYPNNFDDVFTDLENWEEVLKALPNFNVYKSCN